MVTMHEKDGEALLLMKGSTERVLERCDTVLTAEGEMIPINPDEIIEHQHAMASKGLRVLALAKKRTTLSGELGHDAVASGMTLVGLQGMIDPPREEAKRAVATCQNAGIRVKMITGDHAITAQAIGLKLGLRGDSCNLGEDCPVLTGKEIGELTDEELIERVQGVPVFARVSPEQKLRLVMALQSLGEVCAMTGDGVNDAPA